MRLTKKLLNQYNKRSTLLVVSAYPLQGTTHTGGGIASYTKNTLLAIKKTHPYQKIVCLADAAEGQQIYEENGILIIRTWKRNHLSLFPSILYQIKQFTQTKNLLVEFEFAAYGDLFTTAQIILFLGFLKLQKYHISIVVHQVIKSLNDLSSHIGINRRLGLYNHLLTVFYSILAHLSSHIITLESSLAQTFNQITHTQKAIALPHGFIPQKPLPKEIARERLNLPQNAYYVLAFGYLSHYKGSDLLIKAFKKPIKVKGKIVKLILAGDKNPTQGQKPHYQSYYKNLYQAIDSNPHIIHTGFVPDSRIKTYFSSADLCIYPYRTFMAASGPLSFAFAYHRPIITSNHLSLYTPNTFPLKSDSIRSSIIKNLKSTPIRNSSQKNRHFTNQAPEYLKLVLHLNQV